MDKSQILTLEEENLRRCFILREDSMINYRCSRVEGFHGTLIENVVKQLDKLHPKGKCRRFQKSTCSFQSYYRSCGRKSRREQQLKKGEIQQRRRRRRSRR